MRCLYCGKELALLKRLTGGAEFCSDAHRKKYQEEYDHLALNRLMQSHPKAAPQHIAVELHPPPANEQAPPQDLPAIAGFLVEQPGLWSLPPAEPAQNELAMLLPPPALPRHDFSPGNEIREYSLLLAKPVAWKSPAKFDPAPFHPRQNGVEPREFSSRPIAPALLRSSRQWFPAPSLTSIAVTYQPHPPLDSPLVIHIPPQPVSIDLNFDVIREETPPIAQQPPPPQMHAEPLPVVLRGVGAGIAKPVATSGRIQVPPEPQGLPLRPSIVLRPRPVELSSAAAVTESPSERRRPAVRIVPADPKPAAPQLAQPINLPEPESVFTSPAAQLGLPELRPLEDKGIWARMPAFLKIGLAAAIMLGIGGFAYLTLNSANATAKSIPAEPRWEAGSQINTKGWIDDWAPADPSRRVTLLRGTENLSNYRLEFTAQIQTKAIGWMFRGLNPKNYYVAKIEKLKPAPDPVVAFVRYAVIDGKNEGRIEKILPMKVYVGTAYKIRFDATGSRFAVWVLGEKIDEWQDARLGSGGLGFYSESDEAPAIQGSVNAFELVTNETAGK